MKQYQIEWLNALNTSSSMKEEMKVIEEILYDDTGDTDALTQAVAYVAHQLYQQLKQNSDA